MECHSTFPDLFRSKINRSMPTMVLIGCLISPICHASPTTGEEMIIWGLAYPAERLGAESTQCSSALFPSSVYPCEPFVAILVFLDSPTLFLTQVTQAPKKNPWCLFFLCLPDCRCCLSFFMVQTSVFSKSLSFRAPWKVQSFQGHIYVIHIYVVHIYVTLSEHHKYKMSAMHSGPLRLVHCNELWAQKLYDGIWKRKKIHITELIGSYSIK